MTCFRRKGIILVMEFDDRIEPSLLHQNRIIPHIPLEILRFSVSVGLRVLWQCARTTVSLESV
jgi:hypothetical protein